MQLVDAFTGRGCRGNRAAVVLYDAPLSDAAMQDLAERAGLPATAFVAAQADVGSHAVRWFAPEREIALCGHGALAAGYVLIARSGANRVQLRTREGRTLELRRGGSGARYDLALAALATRPRDWPELAVALGAVPNEIRWHAAGYALAVFDGAQQVAALAPDPAALARLGPLQVSATAQGALDGVAADVTSRVFSGGGREDAATGSAHALLAPYWAGRLGRTELAMHQASARGGWFECRIEGERVWLGGQCADAGTI